MLVSDGINVAEGGLGRNPLKPLLGGGGSQGQNGEMTSGSGPNPKGGIEEVFYSEKVVLEVIPL